MANNIITAVFSSSNVTYTKPAYQYDYGMILKFSGIELPQAYEVHFSNNEFCGESISQIGDADGVTIPDEMFLSGAPIYAWTYLHTGEDDGETVYKTVISINKRAQPSDIEPTPVQQDVITQAIAALNTAVEQTAADVVASGESAQAAANSAETAGQAKDDAVEAQGKAEDAQEAAETAQGKAEDAQRAAEQAAGSVLGLTADATVDANVGTPSVEVEVTTESDHKNMSFTFRNLKGVQGDPGDQGVGISSVILNADYTLTITLTNGVSYTTSSIRGEVGATPNLTIGTVSTLPEGSQATATITGTDEDPVLNLGIPVGDTGDPGVSPTITVTEITGGHEVEVVDAQGTQTFDVLDGEVSEEQLETALIDKADVITSTASGSIVTIADGGDDMPVVDLSVSLLPVQNLHGQDAPYPPGGGVNKFAIGDAAGLSVKSACYNLDIDLDATNETIRIHGTPNWAVAGAFTFRVIATKSGYWGQASVDHDYSEYHAYTQVVSKSSNVSNAGTLYVASEEVISVSSLAVTDTNAIDITYKLSLNPSITPTAWSPYSNICPISGWTGVDVYQKGFNVWDEEWESGRLSNGANFANSLMIRSKDYIPVLPNTTYYATRKSTYGNMWASFYDADKVAINPSANGTNISDRTFTTDGNCHYMRFFLSTATSYTDGVCINFSGLRNGEYEPYKGKPTISIDWTDEAGTVYGGSLDLTTGKLVVDRTYAEVGYVNDISSSDSGYFWYTTSVTVGIPPIKGLNAELISDRFKAAANTAQSSPEGSISYYANGIIRWKEQGGMSLADYRTYLASNPFHICYELATPIEYTLSENQIATFLGNNSFWSNGNGSLDLEYRADTKLYIENLTKPSEDDMVANANIASGKFFMIGNRLFLSTTAIAQGEQIAVGTNCSEVSLADALNQINA